MNPSFLLVYEKLERQRNQLMELLKDVPAEKINAAPAGKWSIAQIAAHLLTSERLSIIYLRKKSLGIETLKNSGIKQAIISEVLRISQRLPIRYTAPRPVVENTPETISIEQLTGQWEKSRNDLKQFLEAIPEQHVRKLVYKHPVGGMLNLEQALKFMYEHVNHHLPQIKRLLKH